MSELKSEKSLSAKTVVGDADDVLLLVSLGAGVTLSAVSVRAGELGVGDGAPMGG